MERPELKPNWQKIIKTGKQTLATLPALHAFLTPDTVILNPNFSTNLPAITSPIGKEHFDPPLVDSRNVEVFGNTKYIDLTETAKDKKNAQVVLKESQRMIDVFNLGNLIDSVVVFPADDPSFNIGIGLDYQTQSPRKMRVLSYLTSQPDGRFIFNYSADTSYSATAETVQDIAQVIHDPLVLENHLADPELSAYSRIEAAALYYYRTSFISEAQPQHLGYGLRDRAILKWASPKGNIYSDEVLIAAFDTAMVDALVLEFMGPPDMRGKFPLGIRSSDYALRKITGLSLKQARDRYLDTLPH